MHFSTLPRALGLCAQLCLFALCAPAAHAQIATDRPDFVESSATVGAGGVQVETSVSYGRSGSGAGRQAAWSTPTLLRVGIGDVFELRVESEGWIRDVSSTSRADDGLADAAVGFKWHTGDERGAAPATAVLVHADLPSGAEAHRGEGVRPSLRAVAEWTLPHGLALGVMPGVAALHESGTTFIAGVLGVVAGMELTGSLRGFVEVSFEQLASAEHGGHVGTFNTGLALLLGHNLQLDTGVSWGITDSAQDISWGLGLSVLSPGG
jgi:hypothetical protein